MLRHHATMHRACPQTQMVIEGRSWDEIDWRRNAVFVSLGGLYLGGVCCEPSPGSPPACR